MLMPMCAHVHIIVSFQLIYYQIAEPPKANILQGLRKKTCDLKSKLKYISLTKEKTIIKANLIYKETIRLTYARKV